MNPCGNRGLDHRCGACEQHLECNDVSRVVKLRARSPLQCVLHSTWSGALLKTSPPTADVVCPRVGPVYPTVDGLSWVTCWRLTKKQDGPSTVFVLPVPCRGVFVCECVHIQLFCLPIDDDDSVIVTEFAGSFMNEP